jgi:hypothetical protein
MKIEVIRSSESSVPPTATQLNSPEDGILKEIYVDILRKK